jgi:uncharacterized protein (TIGR00730 family)
MSNTERLPRYRTGDSAVDKELIHLLDEAHVTENRDLIFESMASLIRMANDNAERLNLKITRAALKEMREAFRVFDPYRQVPKVTMFGSARTRPSDPEYEQAKQAAAFMANAGWMVVTGAGPGIMAAGLEGAGREMSLGINIRLPFEQGANEFIARDPKLVEMKYFFTRKLMLIKDSEGFLVLPGGYGTLDEAFELLTLLQTGKADPAPLVFLNPTNDTFWNTFQDFLRNEVLRKGLISAEDEALYLITDSTEGATHEIQEFYRNYHSRRFVDGVMVLRLQKMPTDEELARLTAEFSDILTNGWIEPTEPSQDEIDEDDQINLARIAMHYNMVASARLRELINVLNHLPSAPKELRPPQR